MVFAADYPFIDVLWTMIIFFAWVVWIWMMVIILSDLFRRRDASGWKKAAWVIFLLIFPFLGVLAYLIANHDGMAERNVRNAEAARAQFDDYIQSVAAKQGAGGPATEIEKAKQLLDSGAIDQAEFETIKAKALAAG